MLDFDFSGMKYDDLIRIENAIKAEKQARDEIRYNELVAMMCNAFNTLKTNYPGITLDIDFECTDCGVSDCINLFEYFDTLTPRDFSR